MLRLFKTKLKITGCFIFILSVISASFAADTQVLTPKAAIPPTSALSVKVFKVVGSIWTAATAIDFATLVYDAQNNIFTSTCYYAVEVGINSNAASWQIKHETTSMANGTENLDEHINVTFMKQLSSYSATQLSKVNYAESNGKIIYKSELSGGWLRIYYGLATGEPGKDAPNAKPVGALTTFGNYQGTVKITLTEN